MIGKLFALIRPAYVMVREGVFADLDLQDLPPGPAFGLRVVRFLAKPKGKRSLADGVQKLGPSYIKLGQFLATRPDLVGNDASEDLAQLQDRLPPFSMEEAREALKEGLGDDVDTFFDTISEPIAAASIAQVHKATIGDDAFAVKVLRPGIERRAARDFDVFYAGAKLAERFGTEVRRLKPVAVIAEHERVARIEMDLRMEAAAIDEMADNTKNDPEFRVPKVDWTRSGKRILTTEWIDGIKASDLAALDAAGHDRKLLAEAVMQAFLKHAMRDGFFHADMHPGNLFVEADGTLVAVDFGITGRLSQFERRFLAEILWGYIRQDYRRAAEVHFEAGYVPRTHSVESFAQALRAIGSPILGEDAAKISMARLLSQLFEVTDLFDMQTRPELIMLQKTMVVVEGLSRTLDPDFNMWKASEPVVSEWIARNLGPVGHIERAGENLAELARSVSQVPALVDRAEVASRSFERLSTSGISLDQDTVERLADAQDRRSKRRWVMIGFFAIVGLIAYAALP